MLFPQQQPEIIQIAPEPSKELKFRRNLSKISFFLGWMGAGAFATTMVGLNPTYWGLYVMGATLGTVSLILFPSEDKSFQFYSALSLVAGLLLPWWGLAYAIKPIHIGGAIALILAVVFIIGAMGGGQ